MNRKLYFVCGWTLIALGAICNVTGLVFNDTGACLMGAVIAVIGVGVLP